MSAAHTTTALPPPAQSAVEPAPPGLARLTAVELRKATDTLTGKWLLGITALLMLVMTAVAVFVPETTLDEDRGVGQTLTLALSGASLLLPVVAILLVTAEFSQRTALATFALIPSRSRVLAAKVLAVCALTGVALVAAVVLALATAPLARLTTPGADLSLDPALLAGLALGLLLGVLSGFAFGLLLQQSALAIVSYFGVTLLISTLAASVPALFEAANWFDLATATTEFVVGEASLGTRWAQLAATTALWVGVPFGLGWLRLVRREIA